MDASYYMVPETMHESFAIPSVGSSSVPESLVVREDGYDAVEEFDLGLGASPPGPPSLDSTRAVDSSLRYSYTVVPSPRREALHKVRDNDCDSDCCCDHHRSARNDQCHRSRRRPLLQTSSSPLHPTTSAPVLSRGSAAAATRPMGFSAQQLVRLRGEVSTEVEEEGDGLEAVKTRLVSAWNNVKYGWTVNTKTSFKYDSPIWLLGQCYHKEKKERSPPPQPLSPRPPHNHQTSPMQQFLLDFRSRIWMTYRRGFSPLRNSKLTTDCGWGCMLRSAQMMLAEGLMRHFVGRGWRMHQHRESSREETYHKQIIRWLGDSPSPSCPFSLHSLVQAGLKYGRKPGDWHGPASTALMLQSCMEAAPDINPILRDLTVYVAQDCTVYCQDVIDLCSTPHSSTLTPTSAPLSVPSWRSLILLIPTRLGSNKLNTIYQPNVLNLLAHDTCIGIIGGKPKHSVYFVGFQEDKVIYLDPHYCQDYVSVTSTRNNKFPLDSFHCETPRKMPVPKMDPSCAIGFYLKTRKDFDNFVEHIHELTAPPMQRYRCPIFTCVAGRREDHVIVDHLERDEKIVRVHNRSSPVSRASASDPPNPFIREDPPDSDDDYVML